MARPEWIEVGRVSRAHGVRGEVRVLSSTDNPERLAPGAVLYARPERLGIAGAGRQERTPLTIEGVRGDGEFPIVAFSEVVDRTDAEALRGSILEIKADELPELDEGEFYPFDLIGLAVRDLAGAKLGVVTDAMETPGHALLAVRLEDKTDAAADKGREVLVPFVEEAVPTISLAEGYLVVSADFLG